MKVIVDIQTLLVHADEVRLRYRKALKAVGKSMDYHVYDLSYSFLASLRACPEAGYLLRVRRFYDALDSCDRMIFVNEILEKDRHYRFWFMGQEFRKGEFEARKSGLLRKIPRSIP
ncbi:MAG: hypothetical protein K6E59_00930 [Bacilli bacterium]|nr:hypothetical protein [Bacilli bacterium]